MIHLSNHHGTSTQTNQLTYWLLWMVQVKDLEEEQRRQAEVLKQSGAASAQELERYSKQVAVLTATLKAREEEVEDLSSQVDLLKAQGGVADPESWLLS